MKKNLFAFVLSIFLFGIFFSCTTVHDDRLKIFYVRTEESAGISNPAAGVLELKLSTGSNIDLNYLKFPKIQYNGELVFGYRNGSDVYYLDWITVDGKKAYLFQVDRTDVIWNTSQPLPSSNLSLYPKYVKYTDSGTNAQKPGVMLTYYYNDSVTGEVKTIVKSRNYTVDEIGTKITLTSLGWTPTYLSSTGEWPLHEGQGEQDKLFYGYVDPNDYNKAYYFNKEITDSSQSTPEYHYRFKDTKGNYYTELSALDDTSFTYLEPVYIDAGYRPMKDSFGRYSSGAEGNTVSKPLSLNMVYVPGSYNNSWPYEEENVKLSDSASQYFQGSRLLDYTDTPANPSRHMVESQMVAEIPLSRGFLFNLLNSTNYISTEKSETSNSVKVGSLRFNFTPKIQTERATPDNNDKWSFLSTGLESYSDSYDAPAIHFTYNDMIVLANVLTAAYNYTIEASNSNEQKLSYVYCSDSTFNTPITDYNSPVFYVNPSGTGYRLPKAYEMSYYQRIITDERQVPNLVKTINGNPMVILKGSKYTDYSYKSATVPASEYEFIGSGAGLAYYDYTTGEYDRTKLRRSYHSMGRSNIASTRSIMLNAKSGYRAASASDYLTGYTIPVAVDYNMRNGAGLWAMNGVISSPTSTYSWSNDGNECVYMGGSGNAAINDTYNNSADRGMFRIGALKNFRVTQKKVSETVGSETTDYYLYEKFNDLSPRFVRTISRAPVVASDSIGSVVLKYSFNPGGSKKIKRDMNLTQYFNKTDVNKTYTLKSLGWSPEKNNKWSLHETKKEDRLFYGYVDYNNYSKRYYFTKEENPESENFGKYVFVDQNGKEYTEDSEIDVTTNTILRPKYINAGYEAIEDKFGDYSLKMVYIPGSNGKYIGSVENDCTTFAHLGDTEASYTINDSKIGMHAQKSNYAVNSFMMANSFLTKGFLYWLFFKSGVCTFSGSYVTVTHPTAGSISFLFNTPVTNLTNTSYDRSLLDYNKYPDAGVQYLGKGDQIVLCNFLTACYNALNPDKKQLTYCYTTLYSTNDPVTSYYVTKTSSGGYSNTIYNYTTHYDRTGYRLVTELQYDYACNLITDERQIPFNVKPDSSLQYPLILSPEETGLSHWYKNTYDGGALANYGSMSCLALYDEKEGKFDRTKMRKRTNWRLTNYNAAINEKGSYNNINGCGIFNISGSFCTYFNTASVTVGPNYDYNNRSDLSPSSYGYNNTPFQDNQYNLIYNYIQSLGYTPGTVKQWGSLSGYTHTDYSMAYYDPRSSSAMSIGNDYHDRIGCVVWQKKQSHRYCYGEGGWKDLQINYKAGDKNRYAFRTGADYYTKVWVDATWTVNHTSKNYTNPLIVRNV